MTTRFQAEVNAGFERISLVREVPSPIPLRKTHTEAIAFDDWVLERPANAVSALGRILQALLDDEKAPDGNALVIAEKEAARIHPSLAAALPDSEAGALGLPPTVRLALDLRSSGLVHRSDFRIDSRWVKLGGIPISATVNGARIQHGGKDWRLPEPIYSTILAVGAVNNANDDASRLAALSRLKNVIGDDAADRVTTDGIIERLRISYASGFSLSLKASARGFDFDPVLFSRERIESSEDGTPLDETADSLLPPALGADFAKRFRRGPDARGAYLLEDGSLLFLDPLLVRGLRVVRRAQNSDENSRKAFARNPERAIAEALREQNQDISSASRLFIETQQFSERVAGIDIWRKPVLPWIKPKPNSWLPEKFGLWVGDPPDGQQIEIPPEKLASAKEALELALQDGHATFTFEGVEIPATQQTHKALSDIADLAIAASNTDQHDQFDELPPVATERYFLQVRDNLEDVAYAPIATAPNDTVSPKPEFPNSVITPPKPHQVEGFLWLTKCWRGGVPGALLADDMGLGKTFQALAFLAWLRGQQAQPKPALIVAPTGLLANWRAEIERHLAPGALGSVVNAYGTSLGSMRDGRARDIEIGESRVAIDDWLHAGVVLTTYETMRDYHLSFARMPFSTIIYDEVQKLKNPASQMTRAAKTLNARFQLAMTGTPVENRLQDIWSIYDVIHPGLLGSSKKFESSYPTDRSDRLKDLHDLLIQPLGERPPVLLRRMKDDCLAGLPEKIVKALPVEMPPRQRAEYDKVIARALAVKGTGQRGRMLEILQHLRGISLHPIDPDLAGAHEGYFHSSARTETLFKLLDQIASKREKVLVFCESLAMQALLAVEIGRRFKLNHPVARIHGGVTGDMRQVAVNVFQDRAPGFDVMILSPKAGGVGLTLTAANHVIHLSRWWNPAVEDQATDRAFRIGQTRDVTVYLPQSVHPDPSIKPSSFDIKLHELMEKKRHLSRGLLLPGDDAADAASLFEAVIATPEFPAEGEAPSPKQGDNPSLDADAAKQSFVSSTKREWPTRVVYDPNGQRDFAIFRLPVANDAIIALSIVDPYAAANARVREWVIEFVAMLCRDSKDNNSSSVRLTTYDAESTQSEPVETTQKQYEDLQILWRKQFGGRLSLTHVQRSKRQSRDLHDREVRATTQSGRKLIWDLGRGIDGVMGTRFGCRVTLTEE